MTKTQNQQVLEALKAGESLTALEALNRFGIMRLAPRIHDLKCEGHKIISQRVEVRNRDGQSVKVAKYWML